MAPVVFLGSDVRVPLLGVQQIFAFPGSCGFWRATKASNSASSQVSRVVMPAYSPPSVAYIQMSRMMDSILSGSTNLGVMSGAMISGALVGPGGAT